MRKLVRLAIALPCLALLTPTASAQGQGWRVIGFKTVGLGTDRDTIHVRGNERFRQVRLCSFSRPIRMRDFTITFANGGRQDVSVRNRINAGTCTRAIDLKGQSRNIERVDLTYERIDRRLGAPLVRVTAR